MAREIQYQGTATGQFVYCLRLNAAGLYYTTLGEVDYATAQAGGWANAAVALAEDGAGKLYFGDFPAGAAGAYSLAFFRRGVGVDPNPEADTPAGAESGYWTGSAWLPGGTAASVGATAAALATVGTNVSTLLARLGAFTGTGLNTVLGFLRAMMRKTAALTPSDVGGTFDNTTDSAEAVQELAAALPTAAQAADKVLGRSLAGGSDGGRTVADALRASRNKVAFDVPAAGQFTVYAEDDATPAWVGTYSRGANTLGPLTGTDPSA